MPIAGVVADANVLLSAAVGKAAARVFRDFHVEVHGTRFNCDEVEEYLPELARKYRLSSSLAALRWGLLGLQVHEEDDYAGQLGSAAVRMAARDPDDAHPLALDEPLYEGCGCGSGPGHPLGLLPWLAALLLGRRRGVRRGRAPFPRGPAAR